LRRKGIIQEADVISSFQHWIELTTNGKISEVNEYVMAFGFHNLQHIIEKRGSLDR
jgi:hypothetical protein